MRPVLPGVASLAGSLRSLECSLALDFFGNREARQAMPAQQKCAAPLAHEGKSLPLRWGLAFASLGMLAFARYLLVTAGRGGQCLHCMRVGAPLAHGMESSDQQNGAAAKR